MCTFFSLSQCHPNICYGNNEKLLTMVDFSFEGITHAFWVLIEVG
jgi:hypothetical protein